MQKILLVEDDKRLLDSIDSFLSSGIEGVRVISTFDGKDGWQKYQKLNPNLIITDNRMPFWNGEKLAKRIRETNPIVPIILVTGYEAPIEKQIFSEIIYKPFSLDELIEVVKRHLLRLI